MAEYIEREALMKFPIRRDHHDRKNGNEHFINGIETVIDYAENLPSADVAPVVHAEWLDIRFDSMWRSMIATCSHCRVRGEVRVKANECGFAVPDSEYCPNCGARMDLEELNETKET